LTIGETAARYSCVGGGCVIKQWLHWQLLVASLSLQVKDEGNAKDVMMLLWLPDGDTMDRSSSGKAVALSSLSLAFFSFYFLIVALLFFFCSSSSLQQRLSPTLDPINSIVDCCDCGVPLSPGCGGNSFSLAFAHSLCSDGSGISPSLPLSLSSALSLPTVAVVAALSSLSFSFLPLYFLIVA
jgi:hypothetical protein